MSGTKLSGELLVDPKYHWITPENAKVGSNVTDTSISYKEIRPQSGSDGLTGNIEFDFRFPKGVAIDSAPRLRLRLECEIDGLDVAGTDAAAMLARQVKLTNKIGTQFLPIMNVIHTNTTIINGEAFTSYPSQQRLIYGYTSDPANLALESDCSDADDYDEYNHNITNDSLKDGADAIDGVKSRGVGISYPYEYKGVAEANKARVIFDLEAALPGQPWQHHSIRNAQPFFNINDCKVSLTLNPLASHAMALNPNIVDTPAKRDVLNITAISADWTLVFKQWKMSPVITEPTELIFNAPETKRLDRTAHTIPAASAPELAKPQRDSDELPTGSVAVNGVPTTLAIVCRRPRLLKNSVTGVERPGTEWAFPERMSAITMASIDLDTKTGLLGPSVKPSKLYDISSSNGYNRRPAVFKGALSSFTAAKQAYGAGSVLVVKPSELGLDPEVLTNTSRVMEFLGRFIVNKMEKEEKVFLEIYSIRDKFVFMRGTEYTQAYPLLSSAEMLSSDTRFSDGDQSMNRVLGGAWFSDAWNWLKRMATDKRTKKAIRDARSKTSFAGPGTVADAVLRPFGYGDEPKSKRSATPKKRKGGELMRTAGKKISKAEMLARL